MGRLVGTAAIAAIAVAGCGGSSTGSFVGRAWTQQGGPVPVINGTPQPRPTARVPNPAMGITARNQATGRTFVVAVRPDGSFTAALPAGQYTVSTNCSGPVQIRVRNDQTTRQDLVCVAT